MGGPIDDVSWQVGARLQWRVIPLHDMFYFDASYCKLVPDSLDK